MDRHDDSGSDMAHKPAAAVRRRLLQRRLATAVVVYAAAIMLTGAFVRLSGSGLGCSRWPVCEDSELVGLHDPNAAIESLNRVVTALIVIPLLALIALAWPDRRARPDLVRWPLLAVGLVGSNAVLGALSVITHLHPAVVGGHFVLALALVWACLGTRQRIHRDGPPEDHEAVAFQRAAWIAWVLASFTVVAGIVVTGSGPHAGGRGARRFAIDIRDATRLHSALAWLLVAAIVWLAVSAVRHAPDRLPQVQRLGGATLAQGALGYLQYALGVPRALVLAHIGGATAVWALATVLVMGGSARRTNATAAFPTDADDSVVTPSTT